jgi:hypothetical protein
MISKNKLVKLLNNKDSRNEYRFYNNALYKNDVHFKSSLAVDCIIKKCYYNLLLRLLRKDVRRADIYNEVVHFLICYDDEEEYI